MIINILISLLVAIANDSLSGFIAGLSGNVVSDYLISNTTPTPRKTEGMGSTRNCNDG